MRPHHQPVAILSSHLASVDELLEDRVALLCNGDSAGDVFVFILDILNVSLFNFRISKLLIYLVLMSCVWV